jgi:hypothetical protein
MRFPKKGELMKNKMLAVLLLPLLFLASSGCDPNTVINKYFAKLGLNRLAVVRNDIKPGGLVLSNDKGAVYADNMLDYISVDPGSVNVSVTAGDQYSNYQAVIGSYKDDRSIDANVALDFLQTFLPVNLKSDLSFKTSVSIDLIDAKVTRMKLPSIQQSLGSVAAEPFRKAVADFTADGKTKAYLVFETWETNKLKITSSNNTDITDSVDVSKIKVISSATGKFSLTRKSSSELELSGDKFYIFAVRTGQLQSVNGGLTFTPMNFVPPKDLGIKAAGGDDSYSAPVNQEFAPVTLGSRFQ